MFVMKPCKPCLIEHALLILGLSQLSQLENRSLEEATFCDLEDRDTIKKDALAEKENYVGREGSLSLRIRPRPSSEAPKTPQQEQRSY